MYYIEVAQRFQEGGLAAARQLFDWLFFPLVVAKTSSLFGISAETAAYVVCSLFLAGTCALIVACVRREFFEAGWATCVVVLALPALNAYRDYVIREFGAWFFLWLAIYFLQRWLEASAWWRALLAQFCVCIAALFRPEYLVFLFAFLGWRLQWIRQPGGREKFLKMSVLVAAGIAAAGIGWLLADTQFTDRVIAQFMAVQPGRLHASLQLSADRLAATLLNKYSADEALSILFFGLLSIIPIKFIWNLGWFAIPAFLALRWQSMKIRHGEWHSLIHWIFAFYLMVLIGVVLEKYFLTGRYVAPLAIFAIPVISLGGWQAWERWPRWRIVMTITAVLLMLANVISIGAAKTRFESAAKWIGEQKIAGNLVYSEVPEVTYLRGWGVTPYAVQLERDAVAAAIKAGKYDLAVLQGASRNQDTERWAGNQGLELAARFDDRGKKTVLIFRRPNLQAR